MPGLTCNACNKEFIDEAELKLHYKSEWHRYNLKRKVAGVPGVTESLFIARQTALAEEKRKLDESPMLYSCSLCGKEYRSSKALEQHLKSKTHLLRAAGPESGTNVASTVIRPLPRRAPKEAPVHRSVQEDDESEESEWEEVDPDEELVGEAGDTLGKLKVEEEGQNDDDMDEDEDELEYLDPTCCFMCDLEHDTIENCMVHMHKSHGFFIPDIEFLKDPKGLLTYLGLKVKRDFLCLFCNGRCHPFTSLEGVRKHMEAKSHCKVHYGDGTEDEEAELEDFYDYSRSYVDADGKQLVAVDDMQNTVELGSGGAELIITSSTDKTTLTKTLGSREFLRYYRQKPRPTAANGSLITSLATRYKSMGLMTVQSREDVVRMKVLKAMDKRGVQTMRKRLSTKKTNLIRNLPNNVPY